MRIVVAFIIIGNLLRAVCGECEPQPLRQLGVGVIVPMTGGWRMWGDRLRNSLELFQEQHAERFKFDFYYQDEATCDSGKALRAYQFLRGAHDLKIFVVGCMNGARAVLPLAKKDGVLLLSAGFQEDDLFSEEGNLINLALQISSEAQQLAAAIEAAGVRKLALLRSVGTDDFLRGMREVFEKSGRVEVVYDQALEGSERDAVALLLQARTRGADGLFVNLAEPQLIDVLRKRQVLHIEAPLFSSYGIEGLAGSYPEIRNLVEGLIFTRPSRRQSADFDREFRARFSEEPVVNVYFLYDGMNLLVEALDNCESSDVRCIFRSLANGEWRRGRGGKFCIQRDGSIEREFELRRFVAGSAIPAAP